MKQEQIKVGTKVRVVRDVFSEGRDPYEFVGRTGTVTKVDDAPVDEPGFVLVNWVKFDSEHRRVVNGSNPDMMVFEPEELEAL